MRAGPIAGAAAASLLGLAAIAIAAGDWSSAERKYEEFKTKQEQLKKLTPPETQRIVKAICEADEDERKAAGKEAGERAQKAALADFEKLAKVKEEAKTLLKEVRGDASLKDKHYKAEDYEEELEKRWETVERMTKSVRGANHPVVSYLIQTGIDLHKKYQEGKEKVKCDAIEFPTGSGKADCINAEACLVVEVKPKNSRAIGKGQTQVRNYVRDLNDKKELREKLVGLDSDFKKCVDKKFEGRVDCYTLCPEIHPETNEMKPISPDWDEDCR